MIAKHCEALTERLHVNTEYLINHCDSTKWSGLRGSCLYVQNNGWLNCDSEVVLIIWHKSSLAGGGRPVLEPLNSLALIVHALNRGNKTSVPARQG